MVSTSSMALCSSATRLRPASLDERGLLPTIEWLCRDFEGRNPPITVDEELSAAENDVPAQLKIIIYRIIESVFAGIARHENSDEIRLALRRDSNAVTLAIDDTSRDSRYAPTAGHDVEAELHLRFGEAQERTTLSGGQFTIARNEAGGIRLRASWMV